MDEPSSSTTTSRKRSRSSNASASSAAAGGGGGKKLRVLQSALTQHHPGTPTFSSAATTTSATTNEKVLKEERLVRLLQVPGNSRHRALNELLQLTASHEVNLALTSDAIPEALSQIVIQDCLGWKDIYYGEQYTQEEEEEEQGKFRARRSAWKRAPTHKARIWTHFCRRQLGPARYLLARDKLQCMEVIATIFRNLSFTGANLRLLAYSPPVLQCLIAWLYEGGTEFSTSCSSNSGFGGAAGGGAGSGMDEYTSNNATAANSGADNNNNNNNNMLSFSPLAILSMNTLQHLAPLLVVDLTGQKILSDLLFYNPHKQQQQDGGPPVPHRHLLFGQAASGQWGFGGLWLAKRLDTKEDVVENVPREFVLSLTQDFLALVWSLFPAVAHIVTCRKSPRTVLLTALDLLQEWISHARVGIVGSVLADQKDEEDDDDDEDDDVNMNNNDNDEVPTLRAVLVNMPDAMLERLVDMLNIPRSGPDALEYVDPVHSGVTRVVTSWKVSAAGYDATVDTDVRDRALDVLVPLLELDSPHVARRVGTKLTRTTTTMSTSTTTSSSAHKKTAAANKTRILRTRLFDAILPALTTTVGRNESSGLAMQLLRELALAKENQMGLQYLKGRLVVIASRDMRVSNLLWNHLFAIGHEEEAAAAQDDDNDDDEQEDDGDGGEYNDGNENKQGGRSDDMT